LDITQTYDVKDVDEHVNVCISSCRNAIENRQFTGYTEFETASIWNFIEGMKHSHESIRKLLRGEQSPSAVDAHAIARLQLESLFTICFFLQSPENVQLYLKNTWKKTFIRFLLHRVEYAHLKRFDEYNNKLGFEMLGRLQVASYVTNEERRTIEFQQLGGPIRPNPFVPMNGFPTPAKVVKKINDPDQKQMLARLNAEYEHLCSFAHGEGESVMFRTWADKDSWIHRVHTTSEIEKFYQEHVLEPPIIYSALSCVLVATEIAAAFPSEIELRANLMKAWNFLTRCSLMVVSAWETRARKILGVVGV
jgi:hypothetical protein